MPLDRAQASITTQSTRIVSSTQLRASAVLTGSYINSSSLSADSGENQLVLLITFTLGSLTTAEIKVETSDDNSNWFQETFSATSGATDTLTLGEHQISTSGGYRLVIPVSDRFIRIAVKGTGTVTGSLLAVEGILGIV